MAQYSINEQGHSVVTLPVSKKTLAFRSPKGKDVRTLEQVISSGSTNTEAMYRLATMLSTDKLTEADLDDMDAEDLFAIGGVLKSFRVFMAP